MRILVDVDVLQNKGLLTPSVAELLRIHAVRDGSSVAINLLLAFGAIAVAGGVLTLMPKPAAGAMAGLLFILLGAFVTRRWQEQWGKLGSIWMIVGALVLAASETMIVAQPFVASLGAAAILALGAVLAESRFLAALVPFAIASAIGGSTGDWHASCMFCVQEPTITVLLFSLLAWLAWKAAPLLPAALNPLALTFARICVILVNFGFWIGSLWGDTPGHLWTQPGYPYHLETPSIAPQLFVAGWAGALALAILWGVRHNRRFMVNTIVVFASIHFYTQWFEYLGLHPDAVILGGLAAIMLGAGLWHYNRAALTEHMVVRG